MYSVQCQCGETLELPQSFIGEVTVCPRCKHHLELVCGAGGADAESFRDRLVISNRAATAGVQLLLGGSTPISVGKLPDKQIRLTGALVSRTHCKLVPTPDGWRIEDEASRNGVFVNGNRVQSADLQHGDVIDIGEYELTYFAARNTSADDIGDEPGALEALG